MQILDIVVLVLFGIGLIYGLVKGFWDQLFNFLGVIIISAGSAFLSKYPNEWMKSLITNDSVRGIIALALTAIVIGLIYTLIARQLKKLLTSAQVLKTVDRVLGLILGVAIVYCVMAVLVAWISSADTGIPQLIKEALGENWTESWVVNSLYKENFFGNWLMDIILKNIAGIVPAPEQSLLILPTTMA